MKDIAFLDGVLKKEKKNHHKNPKETYTKTEKRQKNEDKNPKKENNRKTING